MCGAGSGVALAPASEDHSFRCGSAVATNGVPGILLRTIAGVAGAGRLPSVAGRHPERKESKTILRVASSVTQAASL